MSFIKQSAKWFWPFDVGFIILAWVVGAAFGIFAYHTPATKIVHVYRDGISNGATLRTVNANFDGPPTLKNQTLSELPSFVCDAWTQSPTGTSASHWFVIRCLG